MNATAAMDLLPDVIIPVKYLHHEARMPFDFLNVIDPHSQMSLLTARGEPASCHCGGWFRLAMTYIGDDQACVPAGLIPTIQQRLPSKFHLVGDDDNEWPQLAECLISPEEHLSDHGRVLLSHLTAQPRGHVVVEDPKQRMLLIRSLLNSMPEAYWGIVCEESETCEQIHLELHGHDAYRGENVFMYPDLSLNSVTEPYDALLLVGSTCGVMPEVTAEFRESTAIRYAIAESGEDVLVEVTRSLYARASHLFDIHFGPRVS